LIFDWGPEALEGVVIGNPENGLEEKDRKYVLLYSTRE
jgi:hypothetical protein